MFNESILPKVYGVISPVPAEAYSKILENYMSRVGPIKAVRDIILIGGFSAPGLSDIDLLIVLDGDLGRIDWNTISLKNNSNESKYKEIIAHDIFVIPTSIAKYVESYFYINNQTVLKGNKIGGHIESDLYNECRKLIAIDYSIFTLVDITNLLLLDEIHIRKLLLIMSTFRHALDYSHELGLCSSIFRDSFKLKVDVLRSQALNNQLDLNLINELLHNQISTLSSTIIKLYSEIGHSEMTNKNIMYHNFATAYLGISETNFTNKFVNWIYNQKTKRSKNIVKIVPLPKSAILHISDYFNLGNNDSIIIRKLFPFNYAYFRNEKIISVARTLRLKSILNHWRFLEENRFYQASGKGFIGLPYPNQRDIKNTIKKLILDYHLLANRSKIQRSLLD